MKICHVDYYAKTGGAAVAARRLHQSLLDLGVDSRFMAAIAEADPAVISLCSEAECRRMKFFQRIVHRVYRLARSRNWSGHTFQFFPGGLVDRILREQPDIVHLHGIVGEMMSVPEIGDLCRRAKVVWTFHDGWPYLGTEQYYFSGTQPRYRDGYLPGNNDSQRWDLDRFYWRRKLKYWHDMPCHIVSPSEFLAAEIRESVLFKGYQVDVIPHGLPLDGFLSGDREASCRRLGLDPRLKYIGLAAVDLSNFVKGGDLAAEFLRQSAGKFGNCVFLMTGKNPPAKLTETAKIQYLKSLAPAEMCHFYRVCEFFFNPTRMESFGLTNQEALACGTPVLSSCAGAIPEVVDHLKTGYLAEVENIADYIAGGECLLADRDRFSTNALRISQERFSDQLMAQRHLKVYQKCGT